MLKLISILFVLFALTIQLASCASGDESPYKDPNSSGGGSGGGGGGGGSGGGSGSGGDGSGPTDISTLEKTLPSGGNFKALYIPDTNTTNIVYISDGNFTGNNSNNADQIFTHRGSNINNITNFPGQGLDSLWPGAYTVSGDGTMIAFMSRSDILGTNSDNSEEFFIADSATGNIQQLTSDIFTNFEWQISTYLLSYNGSLLYFTSRGDFGTGNPGDMQIYSITTDGSNVINRITSIPASTIRLVDVSKNDNRFVFISPSDILGTDPDGSGEFYYIETDGTNLTQITDTANTSVLYKATEGGYMSDDGNIIVFASGYDLLNTGDNNNRVYSYNAATSTMTKITQDASINSDETFDVSGDGIYVFYNQQLPGSGINDVVRSLTDGTLTEIIAPGLRASFLTPSTTGNRIVFQYDRGIYSLQL